VKPLASTIGMGLQRWTERRMAVDDFQVSQSREERFQANPRAGPFMRRMALHPPLSVVRSAACAAASRGIEAEMSYSLLGHRARKTGLVWRVYSLSGATGAKTFADCTL
jgi:hypothetical protein